MPDLVSCCKIRMCLYVVTQAQRQYNEEARNWVEVKNPRDMQLVEELVASVREWLAEGTKAEAGEAVQSAVQPAIQSEAAGVANGCSLEQRQGAGTVLVDSSPAAGGGGGGGGGVTEMEGVEYEQQPVVGVSGLSLEEEAAAEAARGEAEAAASSAAAAALGAGGAADAGASANGWAGTKAAGAGVSATGPGGSVVGAGAAGANATGADMAGASATGLGGAGGSAAGGSVSSSATAGGAAGGGVGGRGDGGEVEEEEKAGRRGRRGVGAGGPLLLPRMNGFQRLLAYQTLRTTEWGAGPGEHRGFWIGKVRG